MKKTTVVYRDDHRESETFNAPVYCMDDGSLRIVECLTVYRIAAGVWFSYREEEV